MEERRESTKRMRAAAGTRNEEDAASQVSAGVVAAAPSSMIAAATETDGEGTSIVAEPEAVGSAETEEHIQRILLAIDSFTRKVSEMLESGRAMFKDLAADFEDRLCTIHRERVERWEEEIRELRARDAANEQTRAVIHNAQLQLFHVRD
ncbi:uncharacterized protein LOC100829166 isoform X2 [Brachypodium distachyon]|uniref:Uncharacterized protein n=1 Tax=Brachypodium distachyon TaxID=15368 RepID=A0A0Q3SG13_BRADI|nr:uncharacterized protein LOC100829166 isoform X2 [Brachypodium distachyon]KQK24058.1 hypothetical protein BRADI_1g77910v3 [Brachypodium distachyon]|eukprot:XP_014755743.1 uncharacterized protein LOC100829166 isoform X2 [Brachypodium distachyon]